MCCADKANKELLNVPDYDNEPKYKAEAVRT